MIKFFLTVMLITFTFQAQSFDFGKKIKKGVSLKKPDLKEKAAFKASQKKINATLKKINKQCGTKIKGKFDEKSFAGKLKGKDLKKLGGPACEEPLLALGSICKVKKLSKKVLKLKNYTCAYGGSKSRLNIQKKKHLIASVNPKTSNLDKFKTDLLKLF